MRFSLESVASLSAAEARLAELVRAYRPDPLSRVNLLVGSNLQRLYLRRRLYRTLSDLSDHMLADIGIHRGEIRRVSDSGYPVFDPVEGGVRAYESGIGDVSTYYLPPSGSAPDSPVQVPTASADRLEKDILIVPNPYIPKAPHSYEGSTKIRILNVPRKAKIRIFSVAGDLVGEVDHDSQTEGEAAFFQFNRTHITQLTFGVYFVTVESLLPGTEGQVKGAKLVIIR